MLIPRTTCISIAFVLLGFVSCANKSSAQNQTIAEKDYLKIGYALMDAESLGQLKLGLPESSVASLIATKPVKGKVELLGADGRYHQKWVYPKQGISLGFSSDSDTGPKTLCSITVTHPCSFNTQRKIHIGSTEAETLTAYQPEYNKDDSEALHRLKAVASNCDWKSPSCG